MNYRKGIFSESMDPCWEFTAPQFVDFANMDPDDDLDEDKFFDVNNETREEEEEERVRARLPLHTSGFQSCINSDEEDEGSVVKVGLLCPIKRRIRP